MQKKNETQECKMFQRQTTEWKHLDTANVLHTKPGHAIGKFHKEKIGQNLKTSLLLDPVVHPLDHIEVPFVAKHKELVNQDFHDVQEVNTFIIIVDVVWPLLTASEI